MESRRGSLRLARIGGVDIYIHVSWLLIAGLILLGFWGRLEAEFPELNPSAALGLAAAGAGLFFGSVLVHELAHAVMARRRGIEVKGITLFLFGGATEADAASRTAADEFVVAIVGPLTSFAIALLLGLASFATRSLAEPIPDLLGYLAVINVVLGLFNLAPGLPLDGGRVFRSIIWAWTGDFSQATRWATQAGVALGYTLTGVGFLILWQGVLTGLWLILIGWMISKSARQNQFQEGLRSAFDDLVAADVMSTPVITIPAETSVAASVSDYFARRNQTVFPVVDGERVVGLLTVALVRQVPEDERWRTTAAAIAAGQPPVATAAPDTPMSEVIERMANLTEAKSRILITDDGHLVGIISPSDILRRRALADLVKPIPAAADSRPE